MSAIPPAAFSIAASSTTLGWAVAVAGVVTVGTGGLALRWFHSIRPIIGAVVGVSISAGFALRSGEARDFFLPDLWYPPVMAGVLLLSSLTGYPLIGVIASLARRRPQRWRQDIVSRRVFTTVTLAAAAAFMVRFGTQYAIYRQGNVGWLAVGRIATGLPMTAAMLAAIAWSIRVVDRREREMTVGPRYSLGGPPDSPGRTTRGRESPASRCGTPRA
ncbi:hypothetical protein GCM10009624_06130 [Gordonia sinesedis]